MAAKRWIRRGLVCGLAAVGASGLLVASTHTPRGQAVAQDSWLNWGDTRPRRAPQQRAAPPPRGGYGGGRSVNRYCADLELQLARIGSRQQQARSNLPALRRQYDKARATYNRAVNALERRGCYEQFFFSRTLRQTRQCVALDRSAGQARRQVARLEAALRDARGGGSRQGRSDAERQLINELARNRCGANYVREARRQSTFFSPFWNDRDSYDSRDGELRRDGGPLVETFRTMCVRQCDGFYFPVSFSTTRRYFGRDQDMCQSKCAAPASLFVYRNPGEEPEQMRSVSGEAYSKMPFAFRFKKEYVKGCSCRAADYVSAEERERLNNSGAGAGVGADQPASGDRPAPRTIPEALDDRRATAPQPVPVEPQTSSQTAQQAR